MGQGGAIWLNEKCMQEINRMIGAAAYHNNKRYKPTDIITSLLNLKELPKAIQKRLLTENDPKVKEVLRWALKICLDGLGEDD